MKDIIIKNKTLKSLIIILIISFIIRLLSLVNRIILNRMLLIEGLSLYTIVLPSIMLFVSLGSLSLNTSVNQLISKNFLNSDKNIIKNALYIAFISSSISSIILLIILKPLMLSWLKIDYYPMIFLSSIPLIYLSSISSVLRGMYNGLSKTKTTYTSILIEQIFRISFQLILLNISKSIFRSVIFVILAMSIGEIVSIFYLLIKIKEIKFNKTKINYTRNILSLSIPLSLSQLISSFTNFLEPILLVFIFENLNYDLNVLRKEYNEIIAFILPSITMFIFITNTLSPVLIQKISHYNSTNNKKLLQKNVKNILIIISIISIFILSFLYFYGNTFIEILYNYKIQSNILKKYVLFFIFVYLEGPLIAIMQGLNENRYLFKIIIFSSLFRLISIILIPNIIKTNVKEIVLISHIISLFLICFLSYLKIEKKLEIKQNFLVLAIIISFSIIIFISFFFIYQLFPL